MNWEEKVKLFDALVDLCPRIERKGKSVPYTSANGHMFSFINKAGEYGMRFSKDIQDKYIKEWSSDYLKSHGATMKGYVLVPDAMFENIEALVSYLNESYDYVMSLPKK